MNALVLGVDRALPRQLIRPRLVPKTRVTSAVNDAYVERAIDAIIQGARTERAGSIGDGKIFVQQLDEVVRIRTGERGSKAI